MRRRREEHPDQGAGRRGRGAGNRPGAYQSDALARAPRPAYEQYEIYEEYEETSSPQQPAPPRATVVMPAVTLPAVPTTSSPREAPDPHGSRPGWRRTGGPDLSRQSGDVGLEDEDDSWLTGTQRAPRRRVSAQPLRSTRAPENDSYGEEGSGSWHDAPTGAWGTARVPRNALHPASGPGASGTLRSPYDSLVATRTAVAARPANPHHRLTAAERVAPTVVPAGHPGRIRRLTQRVADTVFIPATRRVLPRPLRRGLAHVGGAIAAVARRPALASALVLVALLAGFVLDVSGAAQQAGLFSASAWQALGGSLPSSNGIATGPITAPTNYDIKHYMSKYGFFQPGAPTPLSGDEASRLAQMLPSAIRAAAAYDKRYNQSIEPQMLLYWTHAEGIRGRINYSNCANQNTPAGTTYFSYIANCNQASFWQLGYGNQFGVIYVLRNAFTDLYGDPNDAQLVAKVGQGVLDFDKQAGTTPACGGYSCTFPAKTIDDILSGVNLRTGVVAQDNWWAAVLSRDPAINCYMIAHALTFFNHEATRHWVGCYYAAPCWQRNSDRLGDILAAWSSLIKAAGIQS